MSQQRVAWRFPDAAMLASLVVLALLGLLALWLLQWNGGWPAWPHPGAARLVAAGAAVLAYVGLCAWLRTASADHAGEVATHNAAASVLVAYASQTGYAEQLAAQTAASLAQAGQAVRVAPLASIDRATLRQTRQLLIVASTTGEGDAPDALAAFVRDMLGSHPDLAHLRYGVLALGDRSYRQFCAFGHRLDAWLRACAAQPLFELIEVDDGDEAALRRWQQHLGQLTGAVDAPAWERPHYTRWRLLERRLLNPGSASGACFHIALQPLDGDLHAWRAGDIAEIGPRHPAHEVEQVLRERGMDGECVVGDEPLREWLARSEWPARDVAAGDSAQALVERLRPLAHRDYSIASVPADGELHLLVRQGHRADGSLGLAAGWLTERAALGGVIDVRIRSNTNFHAPADARPLILIGNGSGIAGLRSLLKERIAAGHQRNWLLFGERNRACDFHYADEILRWREQGSIEALDLAFSRDQAERIHVQQVLREAGTKLVEWVNAGAAIHVCGSLEGMAPGVHHVLLDLLGEVSLERLRSEGRYRRDVY